MLRGTRNNLDHDINFTGTFIAAFRFCAFLTATAAVMTWAGGIGIGGRFIPEGAMGVDAIIGRKSGRGDVAVLVGRRVLSRMVHLERVMSENISRQKMFCPKCNKALV